MKIGNTDITNLMLGGTQVDKAYLGAVLVFSAGTPPEPVYYVEEYDPNSQTTNYIYPTSIQNGVYTFEFRLSLDEEWTFYSGSSVNSGTVITASTYEMEKVTPDGVDYESGTNREFVSINCANDCWYCQEAYDFGSAYYDFTYNINTGAFSGVTSVGCGECPTDPCEDCGGDPACDCECTGGFWDGEECHYDEPDPCEDCGGDPDCECSCSGGWWDGEECHYD